ncbi:MAG: iron-sulfur cluster assembly accessory protein [Saprospiraceae bacterium]|nr:iron-sulfur cluster assembly accessory protein [Saprospiraceae bacterium]
MIFIGDSAKEKITQLRNEAGIEQAYFVRVSVTSGGCSGLSYNMDFDNEPKPNDQIFEDKGEKMNASRTCGCGESFAV